MQATRAFASNNWAVAPARSASGHALLAGWSRKSSLGAVTGLPVEQRLTASVAAAVLAVERGARIVRVHDVAATVQALAVWRAMQAAQVTTTSTEGTP